MTAMLADMHAASNARRLSLTMRSVVVDILLQHLSQISCHSVYKDHEKL